MPTVGLALAQTAADKTRLIWEAAVIAWVLAVPLWFVTKFGNVVAHEGGHALMAKLLFRKIEHVKLLGDGGGETKLASVGPWLFDILITMAGYLGPSAFGLLGAWMLSDGDIKTVMWSSLVFLALMMLAVKGLVGWIVTPLLMIGIYLMATELKPPGQTLAVYVWVWFLLIVSVQQMYLHLTEKHYKHPGNDTSWLRRRTFVPSGLWSFLLFVASVVALLYGGAMLLDKSIPL